MTALLLPQAPRIGARCHPRRAALAFALVWAAAACSTKTGSTPVQEPPVDEDLVEEDQIDLDGTGLNDAVVDAKGDAKDAKDAVKTKDVPDVAVDVPSDVSTAIDDIELDDDACLDDACGADADDQDTAGSDVYVPVPCFTVDDCAGVPPLPCMTAFACKDDGSGSLYCMATAIADESKCEDGSQCTVSDRCRGGVCIGIPRNCVDGDLCTFDSCDPAKGCQFTDPGEVPCSDGNPCTDGDLCQLGTCTPGEANKCNCASDADCKQWEDGNLCNGTLTCADGACMVNLDTVPLPCDPTVSTACTTNLCVPATGLCALKANSNGTACSDGDACTVGDLCKLGACVGKPIACNDHNICTDDSCTPNGGCQHAPSNLECSDGDPCTVGDACAAGSCVGKPSGQCACTIDADCVNDKDLCNGTYTCVAKNCVIDPSTVIACSTINDTPCQTQVCDPKVGTCGPAYHDGVACSDGDACSVGDTCSSSGACQPGKGTLNCNDGDGCTDDTCIKTLGCIHTFNTAPCDDGDPCSKLDKCASGVCAGGASACQCTVAADCDNLAFENKCFGAFTCVATVFSSSVQHCNYDPKNIKQCAATGDTVCAKSVCVQSLGSCAIVQSPSSTPCSDKDACTTEDQCVNGVCSGVQTICDDGNTCTADSCDSIAGGCKHDNGPVDGKVCDDGDACTKEDACLGGACAGKPVDCQDGEPCTLDNCVSAIGCPHNPQPAGTPCNDGNPCTGDPTIPSLAQDHCSDLGKCLPGGPKDCNDFNSCTTDVCQKDAAVLPPAKPGCVYKEKPGDCSDGNACTDADACVSGVCVPGGPLNCDDGVVCTTDMCESATGCGHTNNTVPCNDNSVCSTADACSVGVCGGKPIDCDDENVCTADSCDAKLGCKHTNTNGNCGAFAACTGIGVSTCAFNGGAHLVISEVYVGVPDDPNDDWIELYNPTTMTAQVGDYAIETRPVDSVNKADWKVIVKGTVGQLLPSHGYLLLGHTSPVVGGVTLDAVSTDCRFDTDGQQVRLRDLPHQLVHDSVAWGKAALSEGTPQLAWLSSRSIERRATLNSTAETMVAHGDQWLAGNAYDTDDNLGDFYLRWAPDPQNAASGQFEPACAGSCPVMQVCNYAKPEGSETCTADATCKVGCGAGKVCSPLAKQCVLDSLNAVVLSEIYTGDFVDPDAQYVEFYNAGNQTLDLSAYAIQSKPASGGFSTPWTTLMQWPAGTLLPPKGYLVAASKSFADENGGVDAVVPGGMTLLPTGGSVRLWDPRTDVELDLVGWGNAKQYFNLMPAPPIAVPGNALERKASAVATATTMAAGGDDYLAGNGQDSDKDVEDWVVVPVGIAQSHASGIFEPACMGYGACTGIQCNYIKGDEHCVDPACGGICNVASPSGTGPGSACNLKSGKCDLTVLLAEIATEGPDTKDQTDLALPGTANEYVMLYNPTGAAINLKGMVLQFWNGATFTSMTDALSVKPLVGSVEPFHYFLIVPQKYDKSLPVPDFVANKTWGLKSDQGFVRIARISTPYFPAPNNGAVADAVAYGDKMMTFGEGKTTTVSQVGAPTSPGPLGALRRRAALGARAVDIADPDNAWYYAGAGYDTNVNAKDWVGLPTRQPQNSLTNGPRLP